MSQKVWNGAQDRVNIAANATIGTASDAFSAPDNALGVLLWIPALTASVTLKLQALQPKDGDQDADSWADISTGLTNNAGAIQLSTVSGLGGTAATAYGFDAGVLGGGVFRFVVAGATNTAATVIRVVWRVDRNWA